MAPPPPYSWSLSSLDHFQKKPLMWGSSPTATFASASQPKMQSSANIATSCSSLETLLLGLARGNLVSSARCFPPSSPPAHGWTDESGRTSSVYFCSEQLKLAESWRNLGIAFAHVPAESAWLKNLSLTCSSLSQLTFLLIYWVFSGVASYWSRSHYEKGVKCMFWGSRSSLTQLLRSSFQDQVYGLDTSEVHLKKE